jgi:hypothetical protein
MYHINRHILSLICTQQRLYKLGDNPDYFMGLIQQPSSPHSPETTAWTKEEQRHQQQSTIKGDDGDIDALECDIM